MTKLACDDFGGLYSVAPDGSYTSMDWGECPWPNDLRVARVADSWAVLDRTGLLVAKFATRQNARNFAKFARK